MIVYDLTDGPYPDDEVPGAFAIEVMADPEDGTGYQKLWLTMHDKVDVDFMVNHFKKHITPIDLQKPGEEDDDD